MKNMKLRIFLICFSITLGIMSLKKSYLFSEIEEVFKIRKLFEQNILNYVCNEAGKSFIKKYENGYDEKIMEKKTPNKYQRAIIDFAKDTKYKYLKKYFPRIAIFFVILVLDIILIFFWISYCCCCCCNCCCFKTAIHGSDLCRKIWFFISLICNLFVVIFSFILFLLVKPFLRRVNGIACSGFYLIDHIRDGVGNSYPKIQNGWIGITGIKTILEEGYIQYKKIDNTSELEQEIENAKSNYTAIQNNDQCHIIDFVKQNDLNLDTDLTNIINLIHDSLSNIEFQDKINQVNSAYNSLTKVENKECVDIYDSLHDHFNKNVKRTCYAIFSFTFVFGILAIICLVIYLIFKWNIFRIIYVFIWNISMLLMLLIILESILFGVLGYALHDGIRVLQYILSKENLDDNDPLIFDNDSFVSDIINVCVNGDGDFLKIIQENEEIKKYIDNINQNQNKYNNMINSLNELNCNDNQGRQAIQSIKNVFIMLNEKNSEILYLTNNLTNINCDFARNDEMIVLRQADSASKKAIAICGLSLLVGILLGISILAGIIFVHKYFIF